MNFNQILQDSWNFMRNKRQFSQTAICLGFLLQMVSLFITIDMPIEKTSLGNHSVNPFPFLIFGLISLLYSVLIILNINAINEGENPSFFSYFSLALRKLFPMLGLMAIIYLPLSIVFSYILVLLQSGVANTSSLIFLPFLVSGIYFSLRFCLAHYIYLIEKPEKGVFETIKFTWKFTQGKMKKLVLYVMIAYLLQWVIFILLSQMSERVLSMDMFVMMFNSHNIESVFWARLLMEVITGLVHAIISLFVMIFSFRFYQSLKQAV